MAAKKQKEEKLEQQTPQEPILAPEEETSAEVFSASETAVLRRRFACMNWKRSLKSITSRLQTKNIHKSIDLTWGTELTVPLFIP